ncbi:MAG: hypothetical protein OEX07_09175 [Gammaproteobacteria bacterium]|nr:hypothetical protein [Gammaproteobacteria bacterium]
MDIKSIAVATLLIATLSNAWAGNDESIKGNLRSNIQYSMNQYISNNSIDGNLYVYDSVKGKLLKMKLDSLHSGIVKKGDFYVSCADFIDQDKRKIDIDFMVIKNGNSLITTQALVHSIDGKKRKYHLEKS